MKTHKLLLEVLLFVFGCTAQAAAQEGPILGAAPGTSIPALTGKERLGPKWTDEQRTDNCNVPIDKRGAKARPRQLSACPGELNLETRKGATN